MSLAARLPSRVLRDRVLLPGGFGAAGRATRRGGRRRGQLGNPALERARADAESNRPWRDPLRPRQAVRRAEAHGRPAAESFDVIVLDPRPSAKSRRDVSRRRARLPRDQTAARCALLRPGGLLISCSCSYNLDEETFPARAGRCGRGLRPRGPTRERRTQARTTGPPGLPGEPVPPSASCSRCLGACPSNAYGRAAWGLRAQTPGLPRRASSR